MLTNGVMEWDATDYNGQVVMEFKTETGHVFFAELPEGGGCVGAILPNGELRTKMTVRADAARLTAYRLAERLVRAS